MKRTLAAVIFSLLAVTAPAHAATIEALDLNFSLELPANFFGPFTYLPTTLTGDLTATRVDDPYIAAHVGQYQVGGSNFALGSYPLITLGLGGGAGAAGHLELLGSVGSPPVGVMIGFIFAIADVWNPTIASFTLDGISPIGGDVVITNEVIDPTPLPPALPLFGSSVIALAGLAYRKRRGEVST
jgi:hypothetical protein